MMDVLVVKYVIVGIAWTIGFLMWFENTSADVNAKNVSIAFAPWIIVALYFLLFWWG